jgi:hypothetical protein
MNNLLQADHERSKYKYMEILYNVYIMYTKLGTLKIRFTKDQT